MHNLFVILLSVCAIHVERHTPTHALTRPVDKQNAENKLY